jgi:hypothetical protein
LPVKRGGVFFCCSAIWKNQQLGKRGSDLSQRPPPYRLSDIPRGQAGGVAATPLESSLENFSSFKWRLVTQENTEEGPDRINRQGCQVCRSSQLLRKRCVIFIVYSGRLRANRASRHRNGRGGSGWPPRRLWSFSASMDHNVCI